MRASLFQPRLSFRSFDPELQRLHKQLKRLKARQAVMQNKLKFDYSMSHSIASSQIYLAYIRCPDLVTENGTPAWNLCPHCNYKKIWG